MNRNVPSRVAVTLFILFFLGFAVTLFAFADLHWMHWVLDNAARTKSTASADRTQLQRLRQSILNVRVTQCGPGELVGTGFVVKPGFVATAAHVLGNRQDCNGAIRIIDYQGREHRATVEAISPADDLALLGIPDTVLPPLHLANASTYESQNEIVKLVTIGYPLEREGASSRDSAAISGEGTLSRFDREHNVFVTSGLNLNAGNSGGPVFVRNDWTVLGIARSRLPNSLGDGIGFVASIHTFESFFREKTGQELR
jgi:S1-C subfamily serine protease